MKRLLLLLLAPLIACAQPSTPINNPRLQGTGYVVTGASLSAQGTGTITATAMSNSTTMSTALDLLGSTRGSVLYRGASGWTILAPGTAGYVLATGGTGADPYWAAGGGGGGGSPGGSNGQIQYNAAGSFGGFTMSGDATVNTSTGALTLANSGVSAGNYGSTTTIPAITIDAKGRITASSNATPAFLPLAGGTLTGNITFSDAGEGMILSGGASVLATDGAIGVTASGSDKSVFLTPSGTGNISMVGPVGLQAGTGPTTSAAGHTAFDTNAWGSGRGAVQVYDGTGNTYLLGAIASDTPSNGQVPTWNTGGTITWETPSTGSGNVTGSSLTANAVIIGGGSNAISALGSLGTSGAPLLSAGAGAPPAFGAIALGGGASIVTGTLPVANGGTGATSTSQNYVFAGPTSGSGAPDFRALVAGDIPSLSGTYLPLAGGTMTGNITFSDTGEGLNLHGSGNITGASGNITIAPGGSGTIIGTTSMKFTGTTAGANGDVWIGGTSSALTLNVPSGSTFKLGVNGTTYAEVGTGGMAITGPLIKAGTTYGDLVLGGAPSGDNYASIKFIGVQNYKNWRQVTNFSVAGAMEWVPSTANGGSTFTTATTRLHTTGDFEMVSGNLTVGGTGNSTFAGPLGLVSASSPSTGAAGIIAFDNNAWASGRGAIQVNDGTANTYVVAALASDTPSNGQVPTWNTGGTVTWETPATGNVTASGTLASGNLTVGGGTTVISTTTTGAGVVTAIASSTNTSGGLLVYAPASNGTDDTSTLQALLNANSVLIFGAGTWIIDSLSLNSGQFIRGVGNATVLKKKAATTGYILNAGTNIVTVMDLALDGSGGSTYKAVSTLGSTHGLYLWAAGDARAQNLYCYNFDGAGVYMIGDTNTTNRINRGLVAFCTFDNCQTGIRLGDSNAAEYTRVEGNKARGSYNGLLIPSANVTVVGNDFTDCTYGWYSKSATQRSHSLFVGNTVNHSAVLFYNAATGASVVGNNFLGATSVTLLADGVPTPTCKGVVFRSNAFENCTVNDYSNGENLFEGNTLSGTFTHAGSSRHSVYRNNKVNTGNYISDIAKEKTLTESTATTFANVTLASGKSIGLEMSVMVNANDATDYQALTTNLKLQAVNKAGTVTVTIDAVAGTTAASAGTLTCTFTAVASGNSFDIKADAASSLTQTVLQARYAVTATNTNDPAATIAAQ